MTAVEDETFNYSDLEDADYDDYENDHMSDDDDDEDNENDGTTTSRKASSVLLGLLEASDWAGCLRRLQTHSTEVYSMGPHGRTPLHVACQHDAPAVVLQELLRHFPHASIQVGTSQMNPLHITCSSRHASWHAVRALLKFGRPEQLRMRDVDGDTPLHAACRCGASGEVLRLLLQAHPEAVHVRDKEGLTPLLRLWVRYFVILGDDAMKQILLQTSNSSTTTTTTTTSSAPELTGELLEAWNKTELLLRCAHPWSQTTITTTTASTTLHAAAAVDCPRPIVQFAAQQMYRHQLNERDEQGQTPLLVACAAPVYPVRDLTDAGYALENHYDDMELDNHPDSNTNTTLPSPPSQQQQHQPSVIEILLQANSDAESAHGARIVDPVTGRLPLHHALATGKQWDQGVQALVQVYPESVSIPDPVTRLFPFQLVSTASHNNNSVTSEPPSSAFELLRRHPNMLQRDATARRRNGASGTNPGTTHGL